MKKNNIKKIRDKYKETWEKISLIKKEFIRKEKQRAKLYNFIKRNLRGLETFNCKLWEGISKDY